MSASCPTYPSYLESSPIFNFDKPCRHLAGFQLDKGQKFRSEMSEICSTDPGSPLRELLGTVNCVDWTQNQI